MINQIDDTDRGILDFPAFLQLIEQKLSEVDDEAQYKDAFRVFSKDDEGCIPAGEMISALSHLPGITQSCIKQMIAKVDRDGDGRISYSEFRVMMGANPLIIS